MCLPVTDEEIESALAGIADDKAPGIDGFNSVFYKTAWHIIKQDILAAAHEYFDTGQLLRALN
jgi:hypothetical protein